MNSPWRSSSCSARLYVSDTCKKLSASLWNWKSEILRLASFQTNIYIKAQPAFSCSIAISVLNTAILSLSSISGILVQFSVPSNSSAEG
mmetsp:Transcript_10644/g.20615  ORF Transcript_10644/g.20615 Transcript_10644/m.20615 type:complete len:89 (-) Transcript_10644:4410-4676(-)